MTNNEFAASALEQAESPVQQAEPSPALSMGVQIGHSRDLLEQVKNESANIQNHSAASTSSNAALDSLGQLSNQRNENSVLLA